VLNEAVGAGPEESNEVQIPEDLNLLADFVMDVAIVRMQFRQLIRVGVNVDESEFEFA